MALPKTIVLKGEKHFGVTEHESWLWEAVYVGIDQSLTGFALSIINADNVSQHSTWVYKSSYSGVQRLADIATWLQMRLAPFPVVNDIAMENTVRASYAALVLGELAGTVRLTLWHMYGLHELGKTPLLITPAMVTKFATGKGTASKQEMLLQIYKRWGVEFSNDNAADAYALARIASGVAVGAVEREVLAKIAKEEYRDQIR
jgi:Holliday junction resolvasome RuvABC endonuclease subunit